LRPALSTARLIRNTRASPLYYLIWAGPNATGLKGAEGKSSRAAPISEGEEARYRIALLGSPFRGEPEQ
jgi:hypothetical protein